MPLEGDVADGDRAARRRSGLRQGVLHAQLRQAVAEEADRFVVLEVGLQDPALGLAARDHEALRVLGVAVDGEVDALAAAHALRRDYGAADGRARLGRRVFLAVAGDDVLQAVAEFLQSLAGGRRDFVDGPAELLELGAHHVRHIAGVGDVELVQHDDPGPIGEVAEADVGGELGLVVRQFVLQRLDVGDGIAVGFERRAVDHVGQHRGAFDVAEEVQAQATALGGTGDEAGDVGDGEGLVAQVHHAEVRLQRGEGVVADLRLGRRQRRHQGGLAGGGEADEADVGHRLQLQDQVLLLAGLAEQGEAGGLAGARRERRVAQAAVAALGGDEAGALAGHVRQHVAVLRQHDGALGDLEDQILAAGAVAVVAGARLPLLRLDVRVEVEVHEGVDLRVDLEDDVAAVSAVAAVGAAEGLELLA